MVPAVAAGFPDAGLAQYLVEGGLVTSMQLDRLDSDGQPRLWDAVVTAGLTSDGAIIAILSERFKLPVADLDNAQTMIGKLLPAETARKHLILPLAVSEWIITVATADPRNFSAEQELEWVTGRSVQFRLAPPALIAQQLDDVYQPENVINRLLEGMAPALVVAIGASADEANRDPVEYEIDGISQLQVNEAQGFTFAKALRSVLRQDPDIVLVGEIRDIETATVAMQAGLTGHLVFSTLHTIDALAAVVRLRDMGVESFKIGSTVREQLDEAASDAGARHLRRGGLRLFWRGNTSLDELDRAVGEAPPEAASATQAATPARAVTPTDSRSGPPTILLADDDPAMRRLLKAVLEREGFQIVEAGDGIKALAAIEAHDFRLVVLDSGMPEVNGLGVLEKMRADDDTAGIPVIMLTAGRGDSELQALELGAYDFLTKPVQPRSLVARIQAVLRRTAQG